jgi:hypothetical protein
MAIFLFLGPGMTENVLFSSRQRGDRYRYPAAATRVEFVEQRNDGCRGAGANCKGDGKWRGVVGAKLLGCSLCAILERMDTGNGGQARGSHQCGAFRMSLDRTPALALTNHDDDRTS